MLATTRWLFVVVVFLVSAAIASSGIYLHGSQGSTSASQLTTGLCVRVGEPLYPTPSVINLQGFERSLQGLYVVSVNQTLGVVTVNNPRGGGIGSSTESVANFPLVSC
ncbi:MAG TPA: hypothetical protein VGR53_02085 [Nitrososphaerales archaeon]|nr:hypothetical protein [Nitrososphaerales archaeon]